MGNIITEFIPEIWSAQILEDKKKTHVFGNLANRDYEGEIRQAGDQVRIPQVGHFTVNDYTRNNQATGLTLENLNVASMTLTIDQEKYFDIYIDQVDMVQSRPEFMAQVRANAAYDLADTQDQFIAGLYGQAGITSTSNSATSYVTIGSSNVRKELLLMSKQFDIANCPKQNRYLIVPHALEFELIDAGILEQSNNDVLWENGSLVGRMAYGWTIITSNNVSSPSTDTNQYRIIAGVGNESISMAEQIVSMNMADAFQAQKGFGAILGGLHVYGARLISDRTGVIYAKVTND
jgi:hypothetical protein